MRWLGVLLVFCIVFPSVLAITPAQQIITQGSPFLTAYGEVYVYSTAQSVSIGNPISLGFVIIYNTSLRAEMLLEGVTEVSIPEITGGELASNKSYVQQEWIVRPEKTTEYVLSLRQKETTILRKGVLVSVGSKVVQDFQGEDHRIAYTDFSPTYEEITRAREVYASLQEFVDRDQFGKQTNLVTIGKISTVIASEYDTGDVITNTQLTIEIQQEKPQPVVVIELLDDDAWTALREDKEDTYTRVEEFQALVWQSNDQFATFSYTLRGEKLPVGKTVTVNELPEQKNNTILLIVFAIIAAIGIMMIIGVIFKQKA